MFIKHNNSNNYYYYYNIINERHCDTVTCHHHHHHHIDDCGCHVHLGHDSCYSNGVHVSDGDCSNGDCVVLVWPPPHGGDECASPGVEQG